MGWEPTQRERERGRERERECCYDVRLHAVQHDSPWHPRTAKDITTLLRTQPRPQINALKRERERERRERERRERSLVSVVWTVCHEVNRSVILNLI